MKKFPLIAAMAFVALSNSTVANANAMTNSPWANPVGRWYLKLLHIAEVFEEHQNCDKQQVSQYC